MLSSAPARYIDIAVTDIYSEIDFVHKKKEVEFLAHSWQLSSPYSKHNILKPPKDIKSVVGFYVSYIKCWTQINIFCEDIRYIRNQITVHIYKLLLKNAFPYMWDHIHTFCTHTADHITRRKNHYPGDITKVMKVLPGGM